MRTAITGIGSPPRSRSSIAARPRAAPTSPTTRGCASSAARPTTGAAGAGPLDPLDLEARPRIPHSGWPIGLGEIAPYYPRAEQLCQIGAFDEAPAAIARRLGLEALGVDEVVVQNALFQVSPPTRFGETYRAPLLAAPNITLCLHGNLVGFETGAEGRVVERARVRTLTGVEFTVGARCFVLACGGIENPRLLLVAAEAGLALPNDLVGRFFMEHPHFHLGELAPNRPDWDPSFHLSSHRLPGVGEVNGHLRISPEAQRSAGIGNVYLQLRAHLPSRGEMSLRRIWGSLQLGRYPDDLGHHLQRVLADLDDVGGLIWARLARAFGGEDHGARLAIRSVGEQVPNPDSRVRLAGTTDALGLPGVVVDWRPSELDRLGLHRSGALLAREIGRQGLGRVRLAWGDDEAAEPRFIEWGFHHMGTTRMHDDPRRGVVDRDCRVHGTSNLYVAGSSVFPTGGGATPTLTLVALTLRLAEHLGSEVFGGATSMSSAMGITTAEVGTASHPR